MPKKKIFEKKKYRNKREQRMAKSGRSHQYYHIAIIVLLIILVGMNIYRLVEKESYVLPTSSPTPNSTPLKGTYVASIAGTHNVTLTFDGNGKGTLKDGDADPQPLLYNNKFIAIVEGNGCVADPFQTHGFMTYDINENGSFTATVQNLNIPKIVFKKLFQQ